MKSELVRVVTAHSASTHDPLILKKGDIVHVTERDTEWAEWLQCTDPAGKTGWVHETLLDIFGTHGVLVKDYEATELEAPEGVVLTVQFRLGGWLWCVCPHGKSGWIPERNVKKVTI